MPKVTIIQRVMPHYRIPLYRAMAGRLQNSGFDFQVIYGQEYPGTVPRTVPVDDSWAQRIHNRYFDFSKFQFIWQPCMGMLQDSKLVIFEQANALLINHLLMLKRRMGWRTWIAYWGHGRNMQSGNSTSLSERLKGMLISQVDWWFAYSQLTANLVHAAGVPAAHLTILENAVDTDSLKLAIEAVGSHETDALKAALGLRPGRVALFCGGMHANKHLDFLLRACDEIRCRLPDFQVLFIGDGPEQHKIEAAAGRNPWMHYVGPKFGDDRAPYFRVADVFLMPGLVGLAILDSFVAGLPLFTTDIPIHSPEIAYLEHGGNGFVTPLDVGSYSDAVCNYLLGDPTDRAAVRSRCKASAERYTLGNMADRFVEGIVRCLASKGVARGHCAQSH